MPEKSTMAEVWIINESKHIKKDDLWGKPEDFVREDCEIYIASRPFRSIKKVEPFQS